MPYSISSVYEPVTFQEMITPNLIAKEELEKKSEGYLKLLEDMKSIDDLKDSQIDKEDYDRYMEFKGRINDMVNRIADNDISKEVIRNLSKYKAEYQNDFAGLVDKIKRRGELVKEQRVFNMQHPESFFDTDYSNVAARNVGENSSYNVYDMTSAASDVAGMVYSALSSGKGNISEETINSIITGIQNKYDYNNLDDNNKRKVISAIQKGLTAGQTTYTEAMQKNALNSAKLQKMQADAFKSMYGKYMGTGQPVSSKSGGSGSSSSKKFVMQSDGLGAIEFSKTKDMNGNDAYSYKDINGNLRLIDKETMEGLQNNDGAAAIKFNVEFAGGLPLKDSYVVFGEKADVLVDPYTGKIVRVKNNKGEYVNVDSDSDIDIYKAKKGIKEGDISDPAIKSIKGGSEITTDMSGKRLKSMDPSYQRMKSGLENNGYEEKGGYSFGRNMVNLNSITSDFDTNVKNIRNTFDDGDSIVNSIKTFIFEKAGMNKNNNTVYEALRSLALKGFYVDVTFIGRRNKDQAKSEGIKIKLIYGEENANFKRKRDQMIRDFMGDGGNQNEDEHKDGNADTKTESGNNKPSDVGKPKDIVAQTDSMAAASGDLPGIDI